MFDETNSVDAVTRTFRSEDARLNEVMSSFVKHMHNFIKEVEPTDQEWLAGIQFLTDVGQKCDSLRQEFILLSDTFGVTALKDAINHRQPEQATEVSVLGPFYREGAALMPLGANISRGGNDGEPCFVRGQVTDLRGRPIAGARVDVWQSSARGLYEQQDRDQPDMNLRGVFLTDADGQYYFETVRPVCYPIPGDGPVGQLLDALGRHFYRPAHIHFIVSADGYAPVTTQLFDAEDPYIDSDVVFGVKESLVTRFRRVGSDQQAQARGFAESSYLVDFDFCLADNNVAR